MRNACESEVSQLVFRRAVALEFGGALVEQPGLADQVEADVGEGQVFLEDRAVAAPFGITLPENHGVVGQMQQVVDGRAHYMCPTSSGIS